MFQSVHIKIFKNREEENKRRKYDVLIERVFRSEDKQQDRSISRVDLDALEKEISIDIAELRRDLRSLRKDLLDNSKNETMANDRINESIEIDQQKKGTVLVI